MAYGQQDRRRDALMMKVAQRTRAFQLSTAIISRHEGVLKPENSSAVKKRCR